LTCSNSEEVVLSERLAVLIACRVEL